MFIKNKRPSGMTKLKITVEIFGIPNPPKAEVILVPLPQGRKSIPKLRGPHISNHVIYGLKKLDKFEVTTEMPDSPGKGRKITYELVNE